jgi:endoglucanase
VYWDNGVTGPHGMGLFDRQTGRQVYPGLVAAVLGRSV